MTRKSNLRIPLVSVLLLLFISCSFSLGFALYQHAGTSSPPRHFGWWLQEYDIKPPNINAQDFFKAYFLTPPYPSSLEVMVLAPVDDVAYNNSTSIETTFDANYFSQLSSYADAYPDIKIQFMIAVGNWSKAYQPLFQQIVSALAPHRSVYSIGIEGEYSSISSISQVLSIMDIILATGKQFVSYCYNINLRYLPLGAECIEHTNYPSGDPVTTLDDFQGPQDIGLSSGLYTTTNNWTQKVIDTEISTDLSIGSQHRQFLNLAAGFAPTSFGGISGQVTSSWWDSAQMRSWIWNSPGYQNNFVLSVGNNFTIGFSSTANISLNDSDSLKSSSTDSLPLVTTSRSLSTLTSSYSSSSVQLVNSAETSSLPSQSNGSTSSSTSGQSQQLSYAAMIVIVILIIMIASSFIRSHLAKRS